MVKAGRPLSPAHANISALGPLSGGESLLVLQTCQPLPARHESHLNGQGTTFEPGLRDYDRCCTTDAVHR